jgi:probable rRNA maturation factor
MIAFELQGMDKKSGFGFLPKRLNKIAQVLATTLHFKKTKLQTCITCLDKKNIQELNHTFRGKNKPTDILSFPQFEPTDLKRLLKGTAGQKSPLYLGDILLYLPRVKVDAVKRKKPLDHHVTHLVVHGFLHLLGYDHMTARDAQNMEALEKKILTRLSIPDPYLMGAVATPKARKKNHKQTAKRVGRA